MEILRAFGIDWKLITIQGLNFVVVLFVLYRYAYKPVLALLEKRKKIIEDGLRDAEDAKTAKREMDAESEKTLRVARTEGGKLVETLRKQGLEEERAILRSAQEKSAALLIAAETRANEERAHILHEAEREIAKLAILGAEKILQELVATS